MAVTGAVALFSGSSMLPKACFGACAASGFGLRGILFKNFGVKHSIGKKIEVQRGDNLRVIIWCKRGS